MRVFGDRAYLYATHDRGRENSDYAMDDWWIWSSPNLADWRHETTLSPRNTWLGRDFDGCWATDAGERNGRYYWYLSERNLRTGVMVAPTPTGPWRDSLGAPLLGDGLVPVGAYDPCVFTDSDGTPYIVFGVWEFFIARLGEDMISLAEPPKRLVITDPQGPYGPGKTDDKPFLHHRQGLYYLSWGCFYGVSERVGGPYRCLGSFLSESGEGRGHRPAVLDRHGSFFLWKNRWYFICNDFSRSGNPYFRDSVICPVEYDRDGRIMPVPILPGVPFE